ncbi:MAG TPA: hypothetical protein VEY70_14155 [Metabacillus sp.]|nr:hypothetical protein [Metabacillus sp.]
MEKQKFYEKKWFAIIMLLFFAPVGIFLIYKYQHFSKKINLVLSVVFGTLFIIGVVSGSGEQTEQTVVSEETKKEKQEQIKAEEVAAEVKVEQEKAKEEKKKAEAEQKEKEEIDNLLTSFQIVSEDVVSNSNGVIPDINIKHHDNFFQVDVFC